MKFKEAIIEEVESSDLSFLALLSVAIVLFIAISLAPIYLVKTTGNGLFFLIYGLVLLWPVVRIVLRVRGVLK